MSQTQDPAPAEETAPYVQRHLRFGWWSVVVFMLLGLVLEGMHGFKLGLYLDLANETRRFMWTLAHTHGAVLGLLNVAFAATLTLIPGLRGRLLRQGSVCLIAGSLLLPIAFFLGGAWFYGGDPGPGIILAPLGGGILILGAALVAWSTGRDRGNRD